MLSDKALQLLTAYVDGELTSRQREAALRLLQESSEARQMLKELEHNVQRLRNLPSRTLEPAFARNVVAALEIKLDGKPVVRPALVRRGRPAWMRYAIAATVVAMVAVGIVLIVRRGGDPGTPIAVAPGVKKSEPAPRTINPLVESMVAAASREFARPLPPERAGTKLAFDELAKTEWHEHFVSGMEKQEAVHLDVAVVNHRQAVQRLETVLQNKGIKVVVDKPAATQLQKNERRGEYVIYAENVRPDELAAMLYELGTDERARTSIETLTVSAVNQGDQQKLCGLLGISPAELRTPPMNNNPLGKFIPKEDTSRDSGSTPGRPNFAHDARIAMVLANEARGGALSSEIQYFLSQRRQLQPGALQVIVVIHEA